MGERLKLNSVSGNVVSFDTDLARPVNSLKIGIESIQSGSGDPSPDNIRPISGWTGANVTQNGINQWDEEWEVGTIDFNTGEIANANNRIRTKNFNPCSPNTTYYGVDPTSNNNVEIFFYDKNKVYIRNSGWTGNATFISPNNACYFKFIMGAAYGTTYNNDISINYPSTDVNYHSYIGTTTPITLPSAAGTVYGGTLNVTTGLLTVDWARIGLETLNFKKKASASYGYASSYSPRKKPGITNILAEDLMTVDVSAASSMPDYSIKGRTTDDVIFLRVTADMTQEEFDAWLSGKYAVYELNEPMTFTLSSTEISTLLGHNTLYSDCGPIQEASYFSRDYVPVASDTGLITVTDGVEAPIDSLKIHFEPVQEGSGDPSPENVRPISGWNGVDVIQAGKNAFDLSWMLLPTGTLDNGVLTDTVANLSAAFNATNYIPNTKYRDSIYISVTAKRDGIGSANRGLMFIARYDDGTESNIIVFLNDSADYVTQTAVTAAGKKVIGLRIGYGASGNTQWYIKNVMVVVGGNTTPYEPYNGQTYPVTFPSEAGTVYGGYVDVVKGELVVNKAKKNVTSFDKIFVPSSEYENLNGNIFVKNFGFPRANVILSNIFTSTNVSYNKMPLYSCRGTWGVTNEIYFILPSSIATVEEANEWLINNPTEIIYTLSEPLTYSLTPTQLSTIKGLNNIYSNANGAIEMSYYSPVKENMIATRRSVVASAPHTETASGGIASFETNMAAKLKNLTIDIEPVQSGSGDPSPENVRPISGWTGTNIIRCGKNIFDKEHSNILNAFLESSRITGSSISKTIYLRVKPNTRYMVSKVLSERFACALSNQSIPTVGSGVTNFTADKTQTERAVTTQNDTRWLLIWLYTSSYDTLSLDTILASLQVEETYGTSTSYTQYIGTTYPITFPTEAETVYGGTLDVTTGELTVDRISKTINGSSISSVSTASTGIQYTSASLSVPANTQKSRLMISNQYNAVGDAAPSSSAIRTTGTYLYIYDNAFTTLEVAREILNSNPVQVVYYVSNSVIDNYTYQLTPTEIQTLLGTNNIYADTGNTNLTYWTH